MMLIPTGRPILALGLLSPGFAVAGVLLASVPIVIHILNRRRFKTVTWAAMEFLLRAMRKNRRRLRFEQWLLLATRCLVLMLLGLALARPLGCENGALAGLGRQSALNVFLIDNSYSMGYGVDRSNARTHLEQAKLVARAILNQSDSGGVCVCVLTAGKPAKAVVASPTYDLQQAAASIDRIEQGYGATDLPGALDAAMKIARDTADQPNKNLYILTDGTRSAFEGAQAQALRDLGPQVAKAFHVTLYNLAEGRQQANAAVTDIRAAANLVTDKFPTDFQATIKASGVPQPAAVQWKLDENLIDAPATVRAEGTTQITQSHAVFTTGGPHVLSCRLLNDDRLQADNNFYRVVNVASELKTLIVEGKRGVSTLEGSGAFLRLALAPPKDAKGTTDSYVAPELISDLELGNKLLSDYSAVILAGVGQISAGEADRLKEFVENGGALLVFMGDAVEEENYNSVLLPRKLLPGPLVKLASVGTDQRGALFDFKPQTTNRFLKEFANQEDSGLNSAQVFTYWQVDLSPGRNVETILSYLRPDKSAPGIPEDPAITFHNVGQGHVVFVSTTANPDWTNLPAKLAYVPLIHELLVGSVRSGDYWMNLQVGQRLVIPPEVALAGTPALSDSTGRPIPLSSADDKSPDSVGKSFHSEPMAKPGIYSLSLGDRKVPIAVNVPADDEADVFALTDSGISKALGQIPINFHGAEAPAKFAESPEGNDFGWWCMALLLGMVGAESFLAMHFGHYRRSEGGAVVAR